MNKKEREKYYLYLDELERQGKFDTFTTPFRVDNAYKVDGKYDFLQKGFGNCIFKGVVNVILYIFGPIINFVFFGLRIKGRKNLKNVKGAITVSNHIHYLDTLIIKQTFGYSRSYITGAVFNAKKGLGGKIMRIGGFLPLNGTFEANKNLYSAIKYFLDKNKRINFNSEQSMWLFYKKPRPLKIGAFKIAAHFDAPIVPMMIQFRKSRIRDFIGFGKNVTVNILPPIFPKNNLTEKEQAEYLKNKTEQAYVVQYEKFYNEKLTYLSDTKAE